MLNLLDYLTEKDNTLIENYIDLYAVSKEEYVGNETWLKYWNENKPSLFRLLGGNLIYKIPYEVEKPTSELRREIARLTSDHPFIEMFYKKVDGDWDIFGDYRKSPLHKEIDSNGMMENTEDIRHLCNLIIDLCSDYSLANKSIGNFSFKSNAVINPRFPSPQTPNVSFGVTAISENLAIPWYETEINSMKAET